MIAGRTGPWHLNQMRRVRAAAEGGRWLRLSSHDLCESLQRGVVLCGGRASLAMNARPPRRATQPFDDDVAAPLPAPVQAEGDVVAVQLGDTPLAREQGCPGRCWRSRADEWLH